MRRWLLPLLATAVANGTAILINIATDLKHDPWAWCLVALLTVIGAVVTLRLQTSDTAEKTALEAQKREVAVYSKVSGAKSGRIARVGETITPVASNDMRRRHTEQTAVGFGKSLIQQAGGDIHNRPGR